MDQAHLTQPHYRPWEAISHPEVKAWEAHGFYQTPRSPHQWSLHQCRTGDGGGGEFTSRPKATAVHRPTDPASMPTALLGSRPAYHLLSLGLFPLTETCSRDQGPCQQFRLRTDPHPLGRLG